MPRNDMKAEVKLTTKDLTGPGIKSAEAKLKGFGQTISSFGKKMSLFVTAPLAILGGVALKTAANFEKQQIAFTALLKSGDKAKVLMQDLVDFSAKTPFQLPGIIQASQGLLGYGIEAEKVVETLRNLGNAAMGDQGKLDRLTLAFGKLRSKGKATLEELNMFLEAGVPILDELSNMYSVTTQEMFEMITAGKIGFTDVNQALTNLTTGTGKFAGMLGEQAKSLSGLLSTLKDNLGMLGMEIMQTVMPQIKAFTEKIMDLVKKLREMNPHTKKMVLILVAIAATLGPLLIIVGSAIKVFAALKVAFIALNAVMSANPILAIVTAVALLVTAGILLYKNWDKVCVFLKKLWEDLKKVGVIVFNSLKLAVLVYVRGFLTAITWLARGLGKILGFEVNKLEEALEKVNAEFDNTVEKIKETATSTWALGNKEKELTEDADALAKAQADANAALAGLSGPAGEAASDIDDLSEAEEELLHNINHTSERLHAADNAAFEASKSTDIYAKAMRRLEDQCRKMNTVIPEVSEKTDEFKDALKTAEEALQTSEEFMSEHWQNMWEIMGDQTLGGADKVKKVFQTLLADLLRMYGDYLKKMGLAMMLLDPVAGIGFLTASALAYMGAGAIASLKKGGDFVTNGPQLLLVGDNPSGREHVRVDPLDSGGRGGMGLTVNVHVYGSVQKEKDLAQSIAYEIDRQRYLG